MWPPTASRSAARSWEIVEDAEEMASARLHLAEVVAWLEGHGVAAAAIAEPLSGGVAAQLEAAAAAKGAGLLVIGAYGRNRLREWVLGGITRDALRHSARCSFMSHRTLALTDGKGQDWGSVSA